MIFQLSFIYKLSGVKYVNIINNCYNIYRKYTKLKTPDIVCP